MRLGRRVRPVVPEAAPGGAFLTPGLMELPIADANKTHGEDALPARGASVRLTNQGRARGRQIYC